jgi:pyrroloquinoline quinone (PQQ) biosynthesis protein C
LPVSALAAERSSLAASAIEGAVMAGLLQTGDTPTSASCTLPRYIRWLAGNYVFAGQTPGLFRRAAERFEQALRPDLAAFARQKAQEEEGHAELAYRDLAALGLPAAQVIELVRPPSADAFADRFRMYVESEDPVALFGFSYCLERMAIERDDVFIQKIKSLCPAAVLAVRFLKVHSNTGSDSAHVDEQMSFFDLLSDAELMIVVRAAFETAAMLAQQSRMDQALTDVEIDRRLKRAGIELATDLIHEKEATNGISTFG